MEVVERMCLEPICLEILLGHKNMFTLWGQVYAKALEILKGELVIEPSWDRTAYRSSLLGAFLYKALLSLLPDNAIPASLRSVTAEVTQKIINGQLLKGPGVCLLGKRNDFYERQIIFYLVYDIESYLARPIEKRK